MEDNEIHTKFFSLKVLTCIYDLQVGGENASGITTDEIVEQMCRRFVTDGDVEAQVLISLKQICHKGLVGKVKERYKLVGPMARILLMTHRNCQRKRQIEKIQRIFFNNCVANSTSIPQLKSYSQKELRAKNIIEHSTRSKTRDIETRSSKISTKNRISKRSKCTRITNKIIIKDLVDFLQYDSSSSTTTISDDIITILSEKSFCSDGSENTCIKSKTKSKAASFFNK